MDLNQAVSYKDRENEEGLLGLAFQPEFKENGKFYFYYTTSERPHVSIISEFQRDDPNRGDIASGRWRSNSRFGIITVGRWSSVPTGICTSVSATEEKRMEAASRLYVRPDRFRRSSDDHPISQRPHLQVRQEVAPAAAGVGADGQHDGVLFVIGCQAH